MTLYTFGTPNGHKASVTLEELGVPYKTEAVNISQNTQKEVRRRVLRGPLYRSPGHDVRFRMLMVQ